MPSLVPITSPQFRTQLLRKLANLAPGCKVEFLEGMRTGIGFRLKDGRGRFRSNIVRIHRNSAHTLEASSLRRSICGAGVPPAGFPRGLTQ
jgi:hypothetical protein